jgi:hypothetical protein
MLWLLHGDNYPEFDAAHGITLKGPCACRHVSIVDDRECVVGMRNAATPSNPQISLLNVYRMSQEECARLREGVPYGKVYHITQNTYVQS